MTNLCSYSCYYRLYDINQTTAEKLYFANKCGRKVLACKNGPPFKLFSTTLGSQKKKKKNGTI